MKCLICGKEYKALGVHIRLKHAVDPDDYRDEFGILRTTALVDEDLSEYLSAKAQFRLTDDEYRATVTERCKSNAEANKGKPSPEMTRQGREALASRNKDRNRRYIADVAPEIAAILREKMTIQDVRRATGSSRDVALKVASQLATGYSVESAKAERNKRAAATIRSKALARVEKVAPYLKTTKSAAEMCRLCGISLKTYKNWLNAGLIERHPNGRVKKQPFTDQRRPGPPA